ncbi:helix-turn-helix domain-containing protein [Paenibacillus sp. GCM10028914]|uniref:helix-turn-helix domain-containing protein n=1 Tax=Paenibacillus sp. GCM10028914 TaxID=3273416 RepID=UPI00361805AF
MDSSQIGKLIRSLRVEKNMTQLQLATRMNISDKAVSKWERGLGNPDVSLLPELSEILGVNIEKILAGDLQPNEDDRGNMKRTKFFVCPNCGGVLTSVGDAEISCCGRKLDKLEPKTTDQEHCLHVEEIEFDYYITFSHEMTRTHYISFIAYVTPDKMLLTRLYPEQGPEIRIPKMYGGTLYFYCTQHGLWRSQP